MRVVKHKRSRQRDIIYEILCGTKEHPSAEWIYERARKVDENISLATVYRNMAVFKNENYAQSIGVVGGVERFDGNVKAHSHFICEQCEKVIDIEDDEAIKAVVDGAANNIGATVNSAVIYGVCGGCNNV